MNKNEAIGKKEPDWDTIVGVLKKWRNGLQKANARANPTVVKNPSVTTVAERYKNDPWAVLVSTILSLRTKDEVTLKCSQTLLAKAPSPQKLFNLKEEEIAKLAYPAGFYRTKAANLKKIAAILLRQFNGKVPADLDTLLSFPGVGRKTANLVLIEAFDMDGICVDIHVHRISNRTGWLASKNPEETEMILRQILPRKYWKELNAILVLYGQNVCRPLSPHCSKCVITEHCKRVGVGKTR